MRRLGSLGIALALILPLLLTAPALACPDRCPAKQCQGHKQKHHSMEQAIKTPGAPMKKGSCTKKGCKKCSCPKTGPAVCAHPPMPPCPAGKVCAQVMPKAQWFANECEMKQAGAFAAEESSCKGE